MLTMEVEEEVDQAVVVEQRQGNMRVVEGEPSDNILHPAYHGQVGTDSQILEGCL